MGAKYEIAIFLLFFIIIAIVIGSSQIFDYNFSNQYLYRMYLDKSETRCAVVFNHVSIDETILYLGVIDEKKYKSQLIILGPLYFTVGSPLSLEFKHLMFSDDGSVIASESYININDEKMSFWIGYDFANSISYASKWNPWNEDPNIIKVRGEAIQELLQSRGGIGQEFHELDLFNKENKLSYLEWRSWNEQLRQAIKKYRQWTPADISNQSD